MFQVISRKCGPAHYVASKCQERTADAYDIILETVQYNLVALCVSGCGSPVLLCVGWYRCLILSERISVGFYGYW